MRIGIIGGGVVGHALFRCFNEHVSEINVWDVDPKRRTCARLDTALTNNIVFVCLPESEIDRFFSSLNDLQRVENYVIRSTVPIGTTAQLSKEHHLTNIVHSPEFLTERRAVQDAMMPAQLIIGTPPTGPYVTCFEYLPQHPLTDLYRKRFPGVPIRGMSSDESEAVKLMVNAFFAEKVSIFNELRALSDKLDLNWDRVREGILGDGRITAFHTQVPGPDGHRGFGGRCLPKDLGHIINAMESSGVRPIMAEAAAARNVLDRPRKGGEGCA